jgi:PadR family transcriptional regulator, regulatory protein AphA
VNRLSTTSYAILGLLAVRPWSTYELTQQMRRNMHYFWPRAESNLYAEAKRLVDSGLAETSSEAVGLRPRTVYSITPHGRQALETWLAEPAADRRLEAETLVKLMFSTYGTKENLIDNLQRFRAEMETRQAELRRLFHEYLRGDDPFPDRVHVNVLVYRLLWHYGQAELAWAQWAEAEVENWSGPKLPESRDSLMDALRGLLASEPLASVDGHGAASAPAGEL